MSPQGPTSRERPPQGTVRPHQGPANLERPPQGTTGPPQGWYGAPSPKNWARAPYKEERRPQQRWEDPQEERRPQQKWEDPQNDWKGTQETRRRPAEIGEEPPGFQDAPGRFQGQEPNYGTYREGTDPLGPYPPQGRYFQGQQRKFEPYENRRDPLAPQDYRYQAREPPFEPTSYQNAPYDYRRPPFNEGGTSPTKTSFSKQYQDLAKIYDKAAKYGGEEYDILATRLPIFYDYCSKLEILPSDYTKVFDLMLIGRAKDFYYEKLVNSSLEFHQLVKVVQGHFETAENRQKYLGDWQSTTLPQVIKRNRDKSKLECLDILFDTLVRI
jgi:hypothetical protein